ncbi:MAG: tRNA pseudouridine(55) synthase TruB [Paenibacillaceae bacterium]
MKSNKRWRDLIIEGIIPIHKPAGWTSHDVVARMRRILGVKRIGHTGTLDPAVTGVLPICIGRATRLVEYIQDLPKEYEAILTIGYSTDTEDSSGTVTETIEHEIVLTGEQVELVLQQFTGLIHQIPPMYSALKHNGRKLYELAREGIEIERKSREVMIHQIEMLNYDHSDQFPKVHIRVSCSKGTYIRTLCVDIGRKLGLPAVMSGLVRTATGGITLDKCFTLEEVQHHMEQGTIETVFLPIDEAISHIPAIVLEQSLINRALYGQMITVPERCIVDCKLDKLEQSIRLYNESNTFLGIFSLNIQSLLLTPVKVFLPSAITSDV